MKLKKWIKVTVAADLKKLAKKCGCHANYIYQIAENGCSPGLAKKIEKATAALTPGKAVFRWDLREDIWERPKSETKQDKQ